VHKSVGKETDEGYDKRPEKKSSPVDFHLKVPPQEGWRSGRIILGSLGRNSKHGWEKKSLVDCHLTVISYRFCPDTTDFMSVVFNFSLQQSAPGIDTRRAPQAKMV